MTTKKTGKTETTQECAWENGELGNSAEHAVRASKQHSLAVDDSLGLQMISIRLPKKLIEDLKLLADLEGLGYQPLIRRQLLRYTEGEFRNMAHGYAIPPCATPKQADESCDLEEGQQRYATA